MTFLLLPFFTFTIFLLLLFLLWVTLYILNVLMFTFYTFDNFLLCTGDSYMVMVSSSFAWVRSMYGPRTLTLLQYC